MARPVRTVLSSSRSTSIALSMCAFVVLTVSRIATPLCGLVKAGPR